MAHNVQPYPQPREQLRTEAPRQRGHTDKFVTVFQSGIAHVDLTFRDPVLTESADHFSVGVDELTLSLGSLSMLEYNALRPGVLFRVRVRGVDDETEVDLDGFMLDGPVGNVDLWRDAFTFKIDRPYTNLQEVLSRMNTISDVVTNYIKKYGTEDVHFTDEYQMPVGSTVEHFQIMLTENGNLRFAGSRQFWANFVVEVPERRYQQIFFGADKQFVSLHPITGAINAEPYTVTDALHADGAGHLETNPFVPALTDAEDQSIVHLHAMDDLEHNYTANANIMNTLDRRVTVEVSCSLPIKNSPMVDHGKESPDYALARYMFHRRYSLDTGAAADTLRIATHDLGAKTLQGPRDRVSYHHLRPQQKIQTLRLRLWARVRTYDAVSNTWGMKTIICPIENADFWHCRLHFKHRDS